MDDSNYLKVMYDCTDPQWQSAEVRLHNAAKPPAIFRPVANMSLRQEHLRQPHDLIPGNSAQFQGGNHYKEMNNACGNRIQEVQWPINT